MVLRGLTQRFHRRHGERVVFQDLDLRLPLDRVHLLHGPNGCGKSTLLRLVAGIVTPGGGEVAFEGAWQRGARPSLLYAGAGPAVLNGRLTVRENVRWFAAMGDYPVEDERVDALAGRLGIGDRTDDLVEGLSRGQQQKALLVRALACRSEVLLLDEPTEYLDDAAVHEVTALLAEAAASGLGVLVATHDRRLGAIPGSAAWRVDASGVVAEAARGTGTDGRDQREGEGEGDHEAAGEGPPRAHDPVRAAAGSDGRHG